MDPSVLRPSIHGSNSYLFGPCMHACIIIIIVPFNNVHTSIVDDAFVTSFSSVCLCLGGKEYRMKLAHERAENMFLLFLFKTSFSYNDIGSNRGQFRSNLALSSQLC